jgi:hypothetical protein
LTEFGDFLAPGRLNSYNKIKEDYPEDRYPVRNARLKYWEDLYSIYKTFLGDRDFYIIEKNIERIFVPWTNL